MCYSAAVTYYEPDLVEFGFRSKYAFDNEEWRKEYNISGFTHPAMHVIAIDKPDEIVLMKWGFIPNWCKDELQAHKFADTCLNARAETIFEKPMFKGSIMSKRCILPLSGFYEWREVNKKKYPYYIYPSHSKLFAMGCIYDTWTNKETGEIINSFAIVTTEANEVMAMIHNKKKRMPLILSQDARKLWLDTKASKEDIVSLFKPSPNEILSYHTISKDISDRRIDSNYPEIQDEVIYPELATLF